MIGLAWADLELVAAPAGRRVLCPYCRRWRRCLWRLPGEEGAYCGPCWALALGPPKLDEPIKGPGHRRPGRPTATREGAG